MKWPLFLPIQPKQDKVNIRRITILLKIQWRSVWKTQFKMDDFLINITLLEMERQVSFTQVYKSKVQFQIRTSLAKLQQKLKNMLRERFSSTTNNQLLKNQNKSQ